jgi:hypothetical protein
MDLATPDAIRAAVLLVAILITAKKGVSIDLLVTSAIAVCRVVTGIRVSVIV